jgi:dTDP-4-dehydrorhamnose reductase
MAPRYLIIGASGFVGSRLYAILGRGNAVATFNRKPVHGGVAFDARSMRLADTVLKQHRGLTHAYILHGVTGIDDCANDPSGTAEVNVAGTKRVIDDLLEHGVTPVFASSDAVFDGSRGLWTEEDLTHPFLEYGRQKLDVERYLAARTKKMLILRLSKVIGTRPGANCMLDDWPNKVETGEPILCARDQVLSPISIDDTIEAFIRLAERGHTGVFNVCGPAPVTRLNFLETFIEEVSRYREVEARPVPRSLHDLKLEMHWREARPADCSLSPRKLHATLRRYFDDPREICRKAAAARYGTGTAQARGRRQPVRRSMSGERIK